MLSGPSPKISKISTPRLPFLPGGWERDFIAHNVEVTYNTNIPHRAQIWCGQELGSPHPPAPRAVLRRAACRGLEDLARFVARQAPLCFPEGKLKPRDETTECTEPCQVLLSHCTA
jgi:hypothetical protein